MGILWSICCKDTPESMGPAQSQKRAHKKKQAASPGPPAMWGPPRGQPKDKRSKQPLADGEGPPSSYNSINGTGPPARCMGSPVIDRAKEKEKATSWAKPPPMYSKSTDEYSPVGSSPPQSPRDKSKPAGSSFKRSFSLKMPVKQSDGNRPIKRNLRRSSKK